MVGEGAGYGAIDLCGLRRWPASSQVDSQHRTPEVGNCTLCYRALFIWSLREYFSLFFYKVHYNACKFVKYALLNAKRTSAGVSRDTCIEVSGDEVLPGEKLKFCVPS